MNAGKAGTDVKVHMCQEAVLRVVGAHAHSAGIAVLDFEIDIAHGGIKRTRAGVLRLAGAAASSGKEHHESLFVLVLETGTVLAQHQHRTGGAIPNHANSGPDVDGLGQAVSPFGNEDDSLVCGLLDSVNGRLD